MIFYLSSWKCWEILNFPVINGWGQIEDIDSLSDGDKHECELVPGVDLLDVDLETAPDIQEPDEGSAGVVNEAGNLGDQVHGRHEETFLVRQS